MSLSPKLHLLSWLRLALLLLAFLVSFGGCFYARDWVVPLPGWGGPFSYWLAAQGAVLLFILIVAFYATVMNRLDLKRLDSVEDGPHV